jgi:hypothetical protein
MLSIVHGIFRRLAAGKSPRARAPFFQELNWQYSNPPVTIVMATGGISSTQRSSSGMKFHRQVILPSAALALAILAYAASNASHERILKLSPPDRARLFTTFLARGHETCPGGVVRTFFQGMDKQKAAYWDVACQQGALYSIRVSPDAAGSTKIIACHVQEKMSGVPCFVSFSELQKRNAPK